MKREMVRFVVVWIAFTSALTALAAERWNGPGWYQTVESVGGGALEAGPFANEEACRATLPESDDDFLEYFCRYFESEPEEYD